MFLVSKVSNLRGTSFELSISGRCSVRWVVGPTARGSLTLLFVAWTILVPSGRAIYGE